MKKLLSSLFVLLLFVSSVIAQERIVRGTVKGKDDGLPLPGVSVRVKGTTTGTQTGPNGQFSVKVNGNSSVLVFTYVGYSSQEIPAGSRTEINVVLGSDQNQLSEVVVTALGIERQKKELGYAATTIGNEALNRVSAVNVANGLQGKVSGLNATTVSSGVFEQTNINLRGIRSMTGNNNPLLVVDGVPMKIEFMSSINPNDIQNVSVLKGASSAAIYGPDARNGVILITTKKGVSDRPEVTVSNSTQFSSVSFFPKLQNKFGLGSYTYGNDPNVPIYVGHENWSYGPAFDGTMVELGDPLEDGSVQMVPYSANNEREKFYNTGTTIQNDVSLSVKDLYMSLQDANVKGIVPDDKNRRTTFRLNTFREFGKFRAGVNFNYGQQNYDIFNDEGMADYYAAQNTGGNYGLFSQIINTAAFVPLTQYKDYKNGKFSEYNNYYNYYGLNPYFALGNWRKKGKRQDLTTNLELRYSPLDWLNFTYRAGFVSQNVADRMTTQGVTVNSYGLDKGLTSIPGSLTERSYSEDRMSSELFGNVNKQLNDDFKLTAVVGTYVRQNQSRDTRVGADNLVVPGLNNIGIRTGILNGSSPGYRSRLFSVYGSAGLSYKGWANIEVTGRNDWTSLLAIGNNSYFYPGVSGSLVLSDAIESLKESTALSYLKLRAAWSKTGNADITPYLLAASFSQPTYSGFPFGSTPGLTAGNTNYDPNLKPEFINSTELGIETSFFNNRISFEATYFYQKNTDQIISISTSDATGYGRSFVNAASFNNKGVEMDLNFTPLIKFPNGGIRFRANATYNDSEVTDIYPRGGVDELSIGGYVAAGNFAIKGKPAFIIKGTDYLRDDQGRVIINAASGLPSADPNTKQFGRSLPKWIVGLNPSIDWKNFTLSALFEYKGGHMASFYALGSDMAWTGVSEATAFNDRKPFIMPNSVIADAGNPGKYIANTSVLTPGNEDYYATGPYGDAASNFIVSARTWRLRELALTYDLPTALLAKQKVVKSLSVSFIGRNLFLWVPKENKFMDPDFNSMIDDYPNTFGNINASSNPPVRNIGFNIVAKF